MENLRARGDLHVLGREEKSWTALLSAGAGRQGPLAVFAQVVYFWGGATHTVI